MAAIEKTLERLMLIAFYHLPLDYYDNYVDHIQKVSIEDIKTTFQQKIDPQKLARVSVGEKS